MSFYVLRKTIRRLPGVVIKAVKLPVPSITEGFGRRCEVGEICKIAGYKSVLLVTDETLFSLGFHNAVLGSLQEKGIKCSVFHSISSEPTYDIVSAGRSAAQKCHAECIIALGGGSVLDSSKVIAASAAHQNIGLSFYLQKFVISNTLPMISIPSTAGTGAEMTVGAVVKNKHGVKCASVIVGLNVTDVILDSELCINAPEKVTFSCGIDALSHGLEGCLADVRVSEEDERKSRECVKLILENLPAMKDDPHNAERRQKLFLAANYGGNAINKQLAGYVHAFAHTIGGYYHISHGEAIARCLMPIVTYQKEICADRLYKLSVYCGLAQKTDKKQVAIDRLLGKIQELIDFCGFSGGFDKLNPDDYKILIKGINADSINYSPSKTLTDSEIISLLDKIKRGTV